MQIHEAKKDGVLIVSVQGQLDTLSAPQFEARVATLIGNGERRMCIDCAALEYVNSAGLKGFLVAAKELESQGGKFVICDLTPAVKMVFEMIGFTQIMTIVPSRAEALEWLAAQPAAT
jgi:anti-anti-sigma factor